MKISDASGRPWRRDGSKIIDANGSHLGTVEPPELADHLIEVANVYHELLTSVALLQDSLSSFLAGEEIDEFDVTLSMPRQIQRAQELLQRCPPVT